MSAKPVGRLSQACQAFPSLPTHTFGISSVCLHRLTALHAATVRLKCSWICVGSANIACSFSFPKSGPTTNLYPPLLFFPYYLNPVLLQVFYILFSLCNFQQKLGLHINTWDSLTLHLLLLNVSSWNQLTFKEWTCCSLEYCWPMQ